MVVYIRDFSIILGIVREFYKNPNIILNKKPL